MCSPRSGGKMYRIEWVFCNRRSFFGRQALNRMEKNLYPIYFRAENANILLPNNKNISFPVYVKLFTQIFPENNKKHLLTFGKSSAHLRRSNSAEKWKSMTTKTIYKTDSHIIRYVQYYPFQL